MNLLTRDDIVGRDAYERERADLRRRLIAEKHHRRVELGPHCTVLFESRETMRYQVHEMLRTEASWDRPGAVDEELAAYNALIPQSGELSATLMLEYETPEERATALPAFVGLERHLTLQIGDTPPRLGTFDRGQIDEDKVSSVQYVKWRLDEGQRALLKASGTVLRLVLDHPYYQAQAVLGEQTRAIISSDPG
jgi:hypothetical protein